MDAADFVARPQVDKAHYFEQQYDTRSRWSSYWFQIQYTLPHVSGAVLEIGPGNGTVASYLRNVAGAVVTTVDIDPDLRPNVVADVASLPFQNNSFSCAMACEVLEHLPFERSSLALRELRRVADHAVVSVPDASFSVHAVLTARFRSASLAIPLPFFRKKATPMIPDQHYWELGIDGYPASRFRSTLRDAGWTIVEEFRNPVHPYHHFFVLD